jgi:hypothetical protein
MPLTILDSLLKIILLAMEGQAPEQRAKMWAWYVADVEWWRQFLKIDPSPAPVQSVARAQRRRTR